MSKNVISFAESVNKTAREEGLVSTIAKLKCCEADLAKAKEEILRLKWSNECLKRDAEWARDDAEYVKIRLFAGFIFLIGFVSVFFVF